MATTPAAAAAGSGTFCVCGIMLGCTGTIPGGIAARREHDERRRCRRHLQVRRQRRPARRGDVMPQSVVLVAQPRDHVVHLRVRGLEGSASALEFAELLLLALP